MPLLKARRYTREKCVVYWISHYCIHAGCSQIIFFNAGIYLDFEIWAKPQHAPNKISIIPMMIKEIFNSFICSEYIIPISDRMIANMVTTNWGITISGPTPITGKCFCLFSVSFKLQFFLTISSFRSVPISLKDWNCTTTTYL